MNTEFSIDPAAMLSKVFAFHAGQPQTRQANLSVQTIPDDDAPVQPCKRRRRPDQLSGYLTPCEAAAVLNVSVKTVIRRFENHPGVLNLGSERKPRRKGKREKYAILRIPLEALAEFISERVQ